MPDTNPSGIYDLVGKLHKRSERTYDVIRELMGLYLDTFEYPRNTFYNKFRRTKRNSQYQLNEMLALVHAFTIDLEKNRRCTAYEAFQLFEYASLPSSDIGRLEDLFPEAEYAEDLSLYMGDIGLKTTPDKSEEPNSHKNPTFLSYSKNDAIVASQLKNMLTEAGYDVWQHSTAIPGSDKWIDETDRSINDCNALIVVVSGEVGYWTTQEIRHAQRRSRPVILYCINSAFLSPELQQLDIVKVIPDENTNHKNILDKLAVFNSVTSRRELSSREQEILYLDRLLFEHGIWQTLYTPLKGEYSVLKSSEADNLIESPEGIDPMLGEFDLLIQWRFQETQFESQSDDILHLLGAEKRQVIILGESGSGKTTTLYRLASELAQKAKQSDIEPLPILIKFGKLEPNQSLEDQIKEQLNALSSQYEDLYREGRLALLLDGLNEIPPHLRQTIIKEARTSAQYALLTNHYFALTCRSSEYTDTLDIGISMRLFINPLDPIRIHQFIHAYVERPEHKREELFWSLAGEKAKQFWLRFRNEVGDEPSIFWLNDTLPEGMTWGYGDSTTQYFYWNQWLEIRNYPNSLLKLAQNPYMLSMIARVFVNQNQLPSNRAKLFGAFIDYVLIYREGMTKTQANKLVRHLASLAFAMNQSETLSSIPFNTALDYLHDETFANYAQRANLLEIGEIVRFSHQLLQYYFAALKLKTLLDSDEEGVKASDLWHSDAWWEPSHWAETAILLAGLYDTDTTPVIHWLEDIAPEVTAKCILESGGTTPIQVQQAAAGKWQTRLNEMPIAARASIGRALGMLGMDTRKGVGLTIEKLPDIDWVRIPDAAYMISRYPITHIQFQAFIDEYGFDNSQWWGEYEEHRKPPSVASYPYSNNPRERVSWYDAMAFCRWLSNQLDFEVRLPTEDEWKHAAGGTDGLIYPYGNKFSAKCGNTIETEIGQTSAVGLFPEGASPHSILDMSGNVFEWCLDWETEQTEILHRRVLKGGSWAHSREHARIDYQYANRPELRRNRVGFRIVRPIADE